MKRLYFIAVPAAMLLISPEAIAHPNGTRLWGHRAEATARPDAIQIDYVVEIPATKLVWMISRYKHIHGLKRFGPIEEAAFNRDMTKHLQKGLSLEVDGRKVPLIWNPNYAREQGTGDVGFLEYRLHLLAPLAGDAAGHRRIAIRNDNYPIQRAVFHNEIHGRSGAYATNSNVDPSMGWEADDKFREIAFDYNRGERTPALQDKAPGTGGIAAPLADIREAGTLLDLLKHQKITTRVIWIAVLTATFLGAAHALSPGHGKAVVAAYLVGSRGTVSQAIALGGIVTITHILSVVLLGVAGLILAQYIVPEYYAPFVSLISGLIIAAIGIWLFIRRLVHRHPHHRHAMPLAPSWRGLFALGISGGIVPCPSATAVMLVAIAIGRIGFGLVLIAFFSLGLAIVLMAIGIATVKASSLAWRIPKGEVLTRWLPVASAAVVTALGLVIIYQGFWLEWVASK